MSLLDSIRRATRTKRGQRSLRVKERVAARGYTCKRCGYLAHLPARWKGIDIPAEVGCLRCDVRAVRTAVLSWRGPRFSEVPCWFLAYTARIPEARVTRAMVAIAEGAKERGR